MSTACDIMKDHGTEFNMSTIMQCVQELKAWQESEQQKLSKNEMEEVLKSFDIPTNVKENYYDDRVSSYSEIDEELLEKFGYQNHNNISSPVSNLQDDLQLEPPNKNVGKSCQINSIDCGRNQIRENQLDNENKNICNNIKPKKPYLKRGAGLARYGLNLNEIKKKTGKLKFHKPLKSIPSKIKVPRDCLNQVVRFPRTEFATKSTESTRLDLEKIKVADSWNRYDCKDFPENNEDDNKDQSELRAFEMLEERTNKSDFNASSPTVGELLKKGQRSKFNSEVPSSGLVRSLKFERINTSTPHQNSNDSDDSYSDSSQECDPLNLSENVVKNTKIANNDRQNNHIKTNQIILTENEKKYLENYTKSSINIKQTNFDQSFDTELLTKRLEELESEIEKFRTENTKLMKLQREFETERQKFFKSKDDFIKKLDEEKKREEEKLADERKKFMKEKSLFDKNVKELRNKPNRIEREEIKQLKEQITELKEEFNKKEARWATGQARLRTQMKLLENSNSALRSELELFRKTSINKKVTFKSPTERQTLRNTKMIHNVNAELSKLTPDNIMMMIDPKAKKIPASILRKGVGTSTDNNESSEEMFSNDNSMYTDDNCNEDDYAETNETNNIEHNSSDIIRETVLDDGRKEILYSNGNLKKISADGINIKVIYYNGDVKETREDSERYYFAENKTYHSTYNNGLEIIEFPNGQTEKHYKDGKVEIEYVDGKKHTVYPDRKEVWNYLDGSVLTVNPNGHRELVLLNGQREIHTSEFKKRVFPDGTSKIMYPDGSQETKYPDGRIRKKDKDGNLTLDTSVSS
ncbi:T-complex protein 10, C-terminal domain [Cinara cedri]|uniref:T-complex protein 10, C-terminal domain n=1 Tax=Cinara cedri TaxID=506608 RepID=A0A5E4MR27_9HEMI|nr:T-complex protein 10, C-terminal domain [Cinara cedri]